MSNIYLKVTIEKKLTFSKLRFSKCKKSVSISVFGELQLMQILSNFKTSCCNLKNQRSWSNNVCSFPIFNFERNYDILKSKVPCFLLNKNINSNKNWTESKMENPTHTFKATNLQLIYKLRIKSKTLMKWSSQKKKWCIDFNVYLVQRKCF